MLVPFLFCGCRLLRAFLSLCFGLVLFALFVAHGMTPFRVHQAFRSCCELPLFAYMKSLKQKRTQYDNKRTGLKGTLRKQSSVLQDFGLVLLVNRYGTFSLIPGSPVPPAGATGDLHFMRIYYGTDNWTTSLIARVHTLLATERSCSMKRR